MSRGKDVREALGDARRQEEVDRKMPVSAMQLKKRVRIGMVPPSLA